MTTTNYIESKCKEFHDKFPGYITMDILTEITKPRKDIEAFLRTSLEEMEKRTEERVAGEIIKLYLPTESETTQYLSLDVKEFTNQLRSAITSKYLTK